MVLVEAPLHFLLGMDWWIVAFDQPARRIIAFVWASLMAEAAANALPFSQVGGAAIGSRAAMVAGVKGRTAVAFNIVDITIELVAQLVFTLCAAAYVDYRLNLSSGLPMIRAASIAGVSVVFLLLAGLLVAQKWGLKLLEFMMRRLALDGPSPRAVSQAVAKAYRRPRRIAVAFGLHFVAWLGSVIGVWLILRFIGWPRPFLKVAAMEGLLLAVRNAAFAVPGALGVQEGAYVLLAPLFGLPASVALAVSLLKRGRDIVIGVPMLISWQALEIRRPLRRGETPVPSPADQATPTP